MAEAHYFHATLYKITEVARKQIIRRFNDAVNNVAIVCSYDELKEVFELQCPGNVGPDADECLTKIINEYIDEELRRGDLGHEVCTISRFPGSSLEDVLGDGDDLRPINTSGTTSGAFDEPSTPALTLHFVTTQGSAQPKLKLFRLVDLPNDVLPRILVPKGSQGRKLADRGMTCRSVCPDDRNRQLIFNGSRGYPLPAISDSEERAFLAMAPFHTIIGNAAEPEAPPGIRHWRFKPGHEVNVKQWIQGMGQTELVDPDEDDTRKMPKETRKMIIADQSHQDPTLGRVRVPKGAQLGDQSDAESSEDERSGCLDFKQLLAGAASGNRLRTHSDASSEESDDSDASKAGKKDFSSLLRPKPTENTRPPASSVATAQHSSVSKSTMTPSYVAASTRSASPSTHPADGLDESQSSKPRSESETSSPWTSAEAKAEAVQSYGKDFAKTDTIGLTANPASQALWEHQNGRRPGKKPVKSGVYITNRSSSNLMPIPTTGSAPMSLSTGRDLRLPTPPQIMAARSTSQADMRTDTSHSPGNEPWANNIVQPTDTSSPPDNPPWANNIVQPRQSLRTLIGNFAPPSAPRESRLPPGLGPPPSLPGASRRQSAREMMAQSSHANGSLIPTDGGVWPTMPGTVKPPPGLTARPLRPSSGHMDARMAIPPVDNGDEIVERLQPVTENSPVKRSTMRQRAPKKAKKQGGTVSKGSGKNKVELPLPDPLPPPRPKKSAKEKITTGPNGFGTRSQGQTGPKPLNSGPLRTKAATQNGPARGDNLALSGAESSAVTNTDLMRSRDERGGAFRDDSDNGGSPAEDTPEVPVSELEQLLPTDAQGRKCFFSMQFGLILLTHGDKAMRTDAFLATSFDSAEVQLVAFVPRLTTSTGDAKYLLDVLDTSAPIDARAVYEFVVEDQSKCSWTIRCASDAAPLPVHNEVFGTAYTHHPHRVWDTRCVVATASKTKHAEAERQFLSSLTTAEEPPSFYAKVPKNSFVVQKAFAKREFAREVESGIRLVVTEVQELELVHVDAPTVNVKATCLDREYAIEEQRLWWEAKLEAGCDVDLLRLQAVTDHFIVEMDGVGYANVGPWTKLEVEPEPEPIIPFW